MTETQFGGTQFSGSSPVARYWLARCEGFAVQGGEHGVVEELIRDADPFVTTRLVVRTRGRRKKLVAAAAIASVDPAERVLVVQRRRTTRPTLHVRATTAAASRSVPPAARRARSAMEPVGTALRSAGAAAAAGSLRAWSVARAKTPVAARYARRTLAPAERVVVQSFRLLLAEARSTVGIRRPATTRTRSTLSRRGGRARSAD